MKNITFVDFKKMFFDFCAEKGHNFTPPDSLVPLIASDVLFTNSGMLPMVGYMLSGQHPNGSRLFNIQNVVRTGALSMVGDTSHETYFEVFGMWSFGDYDAKEAIGFVIEFLTGQKWLSLEFDKLHCTCFIGDDVIKQNVELLSVLRDFGFESTHIHLSKKNKKGPYKESGLFGENIRFYYDRGTLPCCNSCNPYCRCDKYTEIWDIVFFQQYYDSDGGLCDLPNNIIDMGGGFDRLLTLVNGKNSVFETDLYAPIITCINDVADIDSLTDVRDARIIADHIRCIVFILGDVNKVLPSNSGRGYVLRRLIRTVFKKLDDIGAKSDSIGLLANEVVKMYSPQYPQLHINRAFVFEQIEAEKRKYTVSVEKGEKEIRKIFKSGRNGNKMSAEIAKMLYSRYGVPTSKIIKIANEYGIVVDAQGAE